jgi:hypothetical protein
VPNRNLTPDELVHANNLLSEIRVRLRALAGDDPLLLFAYRRKVVKELGYDERSKPSARNKLKAMKWGLQGRKCAHCGEEMPLKYSELDRKNAADGYTEENTELVHAKCHHDRQAAKSYT